MEFVRSVSDSTCTMLVSNHAMSQPSDASVTFYEGPETDQRGGWLHVELQDVEASRVTKWCQCMNQHSTNQQSANQRSTNQRSTN